MPKEVRYAAITALILTIVTMFIDRRISAGIVLGHLFSMLHLFLLTKTADAIFDQKHINFFAFSLSTLIRYAIIALPLVISFLYPSYFNIFASVLGFTIYKFVIVAFAIINKD